MTCLDGGGGGGPEYGGGGGGGADYDSGGSLEDVIPGTPGVDYPVLAQVPDTGFSCDGQVGCSRVLCRQVFYCFIRPDVAG